MKAILRNYDNEEYVVKNIEVAYNDKYTCNNKIIEETNILTMLDNKSKFLKCTACGELVRNTKKDIEKHLDRTSSYENCIGCPHLKSEILKNVATKYTKKEDDTFVLSSKSNVNLVCGNKIFHNVSITDAKRLDYCAYKKCTKGTLLASETFFSQYPNAFDEMITVDAIKFKNVCVNYSYTELQLKCRGSLFACVNNKGIVDFFKFRTHYVDYILYYSKKYNKIFYNNRNRYQEWNCDYYVSSDRIDYIKKTIANLYV